MVVKFDDCCIVIVTAFSLCIVHYLFLKLKCKIHFLA
jgi:hypothetical protein